MTTPTQHLEIFDEKHWSRMIKEHKWADEIMLNDIRQHLIQTVISVLEEEIEVQKSTRKGLSGYFPGYNEPWDNAKNDTINSLATTLSTWKALL